MFRSIKLMSGLANATEGRRHLLMRISTRNMPSPLKHGISCSMRLFPLRDVKQKPIWNALSENRKQAEFVRKKRWIKCLRDGKTSF